MRKTRTSWKQIDRPVAGPPHPPGEDALISAGAATWAKLRGLAVRPSPRRRRGRRSRARPGRQTIAATVTTGGRSPVGQRLQRLARRLVAHLGLRVAALHRVRAGSCAARRSLAPAPSAAGRHPVACACAAPQPPGATPRRDPSALEGAPQRFGGDLGVGRVADRPHHAQPPRPRPHHLLGVQRADPADREERLRACSAAWLISSSPTAGRPGFVGVSQTGPTAK